MTQEEVLRAVGAVEAKLEGALKEHIKTQSEGAKEEVKNLLGELESKLKGENQKQFNELAAEVQTMKKNGMHQGKAIATIADQIYHGLTETKKEAFTAYQATKRGDLQLQLKTVGTMTTSTNTSGTLGVVDNVYVPGIKPELYTRGRIRNILQAGTTTGNAVPFVKGSAGEGSINTTAEGATKNQVDNDLAQESAPVRKITGFVRVSDELLNDVPALSSYLSYSLTGRMLDKEDQQLLFGLGTGTEIGGIAGTANTLLQTAANLSVGFAVTDPNIYDCMVAAIAHLASLQYRASVVAMNPVDLYKMALSKGSNGQYVSPIFYQNGIPTLFGYQIYETTAVPQDNLLVLDATRATQIFQRDAMGIRFFDQDSDNATKNLITIVAEERLALPIFYGDAVFYDNIGDIEAAIGNS